MIELNRARASLGLGALATILATLALVGCGGEKAVEPTAAPASPTVSEPSSPSTPIESPPGTSSANGTVPAGSQAGPADFIGKPLDLAGAYADELGQPWRVGKVDGEQMLLTEDYVVGRVTFSVVDSIVVDATIEGAKG